MYIGDNVASSNRIRSSYLPFSAKNITISRFDAAYNIAIFFYDVNHICLLSSYLMNKNSYQTTFPFTLSVPPPTAFIKLDIGKVDGSAINVNSITGKEFKIESGSVATDWSSSFDDLKVSIDLKTQKFTGTQNPTPPYVQGRDIWSNGTDLYECAVTRAAGEAYVAGDFVKATGYDNTKTVIDGGVVTSGTVQLAGDASTILAGITGQGTASTSVRVWAGGSFAARATANFRVLQSGDAYAKGGFYIQDTNNVTFGGFRGNITADNGVVFWFGNATPENGNLIMQRNGSIILNNASLTSRYNNNDSGYSVVINSGALSFRFKGVETGYVKSKHIVMNGNYSDKIDIQPESLRMDHKNGSVGVSFFTYNNNLRAKLSSGLTGGLQITMENLPTTAPALANQVWRDSNGFLKIT